MAHPARSDTVQSPWLDYEQAAEYVRLAPGTLKNLVSARQIPVYGRRNRRVFRRDMLDLWLVNPGLALRKWEAEIADGRPTSR